MTTLPTERRSALRGGLAVLVLGLAIMAAPATGGLQRPAPSLVRQFVYHEAALTWTDASELCRVNQGHLGYPYSQADVDYFHLLLSTYNLTRIHAGFHDLFAPGAFSTIQGEALSDTCYTSWAPGYPTLASTPVNCGGFTEAGLVDLSCVEALPFVCEQDLWSDYELMPGHGRYKLHNESVTWGDAAAACRAERAHLLILNSEEELAALYSVYVFDLLWIGVQHILVDRQFTTLYGRMLSAAILCAVVCLCAGAAVPQPRQTRIDIFTDPLDWASAATFCRTNNGHLFYPNDQSQFDELATMMAAAGVTQLHAGFHDLFGEGRYTTIDDEPIDDTCYSTWAPGFPLVGAATNCGGFDVDGLVNWPCSDEQPFVCETNLWADYIPILGHGLYKYHPEQVSWSDAVMMCQAEGASLLVINSEEELSAVHAQFAFAFSWIGAQHVLVDRRFLTIFDVPLADTGFERWMQDEPFGTNVEFPFVQLQATDGYLIENDFEAFVCERRV